MKTDYTVAESSRFDAPWSDYRNGFGSPTQKYMQYDQFNGVTLPNVVEK